VFIGLLSALYCLGCSTLDEKMQARMAEPRDKLIEDFGPPDNEIGLSNGGRSLVWIQPWASGDSKGFSAGTCRKVFNLNNEGLVSSASAHGCGWGVCLGRFCW